MKAEILTSLMTRALRSKAEQGDIARELNDDKQEAIGEHGLHARAFSICLALKRMDQVKRLALLEAFDEYRQTIKLDDAPQTEAFEEHRRRAS